MLDFHYFALYSIDSYGVCSFNRLPPLLPCRGLAAIPAEARSVIVCLFPFYVEEFPCRNVSRYAVGDDYHIIGMSILDGIVRLLKRDYPEESFAFFIDNSPVPEVAAARLAGLGVEGDHGLLIHDRYGSCVLIGSIVTTLALEPSLPREVQGCLHCGRCREACPTGALTEEGLAAHRCRSYLTQKKGELTRDEQMEVALGKMAWGCDLCADACPLNQTPEKSPIPAFYQNLSPILTLSALDSLKGTKAYEYKGKAVLQRNLRLIQERSAEYGNV